MSRTSVSWRERPAALRAGGRLLARDDHLAAGLAVPGRDAVAPPELAARRTSRGCSASTRSRSCSSSRARSGCGRPRPPRCAGSASGFVLHEPLRGEARLHHRLAALAVAERHRVRRRLHQQALAPRAARRCPCAPRSGPGPRTGPAFVVQHGALVHDVDGRQAEALARLEVVRVVRGRHLHRAGPELAVDEARPPPPGSRGRARAASASCPMQVPVALVVRVHGHRRVAEHRLRTRGRHHDRPRRRPRPG